MKKLFLLTITLAFLVAPYSIFAGGQPGAKIKKGTVPAWRIQIIDELGKPVKGARVVQIWQDYAVEENGHEAEAISDENGYVSFPQRKVKKGNSLTRTVGKLKNAASEGVHASFDTDVQIVAWKNDRRGGVSYEPGKPLQTQLIIRPQPIPKGGA